MPRLPVGEIRKMTAFPELQSQQVASVKDLMQVAFSKVPRLEINRPYFGRGLTQERIERCIRHAAVGFMRDLTDLSRETMGLDPHLAATVGKRIGAVASAPWDLVPATGPGVDDATAKLYVDVVREQLERVEHFAQARRQLAWGLFDARAALENHWVYRAAPDERGVQWHLAEFGWIHPRRLSLGPQRELRIVDDPVAAYSFAEVGISLDDPTLACKFVQFKPQLFGDYPEREGLAPRCLYWSFFKRFSARDRMILLELFGRPWRIVEVDEDSQADGPALDKAAEIADQMGSTTTARMPRGTRLKVEQVGQNAGQQHADVIAESDRQISKLVLGQTGTTDGVPSGLNSNQTAIMQDEQMLIFQSDCTMLAEAIEDGVVDAIIRLNFGVDALINSPRFVLRAEVPPDRKSEAERLKAALDAGLEVAVDEAYEAIGFRRPQDGEAYLQMQDNGMGLGQRVPVIVEAADPNDELGRLREEVEKLKNPGAQPAAPAAPTSGAEPAAAGGAAPGEIQIGVSTIEKVFTVNEVRESQGMGPLMLPDGSGPDPDGALTVAEFEAKRAAKAGVVGEAEGAVEAPADPNATPAPEPTPEGKPAPANGKPGAPAPEPAKPSPEPAPAEPGAAAKPKLAPPPLAATSSALTEHAIAALSSGAVLWRATGHAAHCARERQPETTYGTLENVIEAGVREAARVCDRWAAALASAVEGKRDAASIARAIKQAAPKLDTLSFARAIERRLVHSTMTGALDSQFEADHDEQVAPEAFPEPEGAKAGAWHNGERVQLIDFTAPGKPVKPLPKFTKMPYRDALKYFGNKQPITKGLFEKLKGAAKARSFTVAGLASEHAVGLVQAELTKAITEGRTLEHFASEVKARLESAGLSALRPSHVETVFRTNLLDAYNAGRRAEMAQPERLKLRPYWRINGVGDARSRDSHRMVKGWVLRADDPFWRTHGGPPFGYNCRCRISSISAKRAEGLTLHLGAELVSLGIPDEGFEPNALFPPDLIGDINA